MKASAITVILSESFLFVSISHPVLAFAHADCVVMAVLWLKTCGSKFSDSSAGPGVYVIKVVVKSERCRWIEGER